MNLIYNPNFILRIVGFVCESVCDHKRITTVSLADGRISARGIVGVATDYGFQPSHPLALFNLKVEKG